jgi:hypothetical protein
MSTVTPEYAAIHIPKTGCHTVQKVLKQLYGEQARSVGPFHSVPPYYDLKDRKVFTFVRHPAPWLRSFWGFRLRNKWKPAVTRNLLWNDICAILDPYGCDDFDLFAKRVTDNEPGVIGWFFDRFFPWWPIEIGYTHSMENDLKRFVPKVQEVPRQMVGQNLPAFTEETWNAIYIAEWGFINRFNMRHLTIDDFPAERSTEGVGTIQYVRR